MLVTVLFATRGSEIQRELKETGERIKEKLPELPEVPELPGLPGPVPGTGSNEAIPAEPTSPPEPEGGRPSPKTEEPVKPKGTGSPPAETAEPKPPAYTLKEPPPVVATRHRVMPGDTLYSLAETYYENGSLWPLIAEANNLKEPGELRQGSEVVIPGRR
ncbi:MAG: LysM peptidoglycan-binding domain-containing protein [Planctomycetota bacterium]